MITLEDNLALSLHQRIKKYPKHAAIMRKKQGKWLPVSWMAVERKVASLSKWFLDNGVKAEDGVAILSENQPNWYFFDLAIMSIGAYTVPIYPSLLESEVFYILDNSKAKVIVVENEIQLKKVLNVKDKLPDLEKIILLEGHSELETDAKIYSFKECAQHEQFDNPEFYKKFLETWRDLALDIKPEQLATIVYTSGTTGLPKGVELTHLNLVAVLKDVCEVFDVNEQDRTLLFLPMSHVLGRLEPFMGIACGWVNAFSSGFKNLVNELEEVKPSVLISVPRVYEKTYSAIHNKIQSSGKKEKAVFKWALKVGNKRSKLLEQGRRPSLLLNSQYNLAKKLVFDKIKKKFGGQIKFCVSGGAPLSIDLARFFHSCGIQILEGYGLTETAAPVFANHRFDYRFGTVGKALPSTQVKLSEDNEICIKGPGVFNKYHKNDQATQESFDVDGWFLTGDIGDITNEGFLRITDRKKNLIVTAGGKNIAPQKVENLMRKSPLFSSLLVIGDQRKYLSLLMTLDPDQLKKLISDLGLPKPLFTSGFSKNLEIKKHIQNIINDINEDLPKHETIKKFCIVENEFTVESGELTPSLKIKRKFCEKKYKELIESMY